MGINQKSVNCDVCASEYFSDELVHVKLASFPKPMNLCEECLAKTTYENYKDAAQRLIAVRSLARKDKGNAEIRLREIKKLLDE